MLVGFFWMCVRDLPTLVTRSLIRVPVEKHPSPGSLSGRPLAPNEDLPYDFDVPEVLNDHVLIKDASICRHSAVSAGSR